MYCVNSVYWFDDILQELDYFWNVNAGSFTDYEQEVLSYRILIWLKDLFTNRE